MTIPSLTPLDDEIKQQAEKFARTHKKQIAAERTPIEKYPPDTFPLSAFMAGSPGAGKTEVSKRLLEILEDKINHSILRIDGDELRELLPSYIGSNSFLFQTAISILVEKIHDMALENKQAFLLDGTFSNYEKAKFNIQRSVDKGRQVIIFYIYQRPEVAWKFTQAREVTEGRHIPKEAFIDQFIAARETVSRIREEFDDRVTIILIKKDFETHAVEDIVEIKIGKDELDHYLGQAYTHSDLNALL